MSNQEFEITEKTANAVNSHLSIPTGPIRLLTIRSGLCLEIRNPGMRLTGKAPKCSTILRREFGLKGKPVKLLAQFETLLQMVQVVEQGDCNTVFDNGELRILTREEKAEFDKQRTCPDCEKLSIVDTGEEFACQREECGATF